VATKTGNTYIFGTMSNRMTVPTANIGFSNTTSATKLIPDDCDIDRQPEMVCGPQTGNTYISGTMTGRMTIPTANLGFLTTLSTKKN